ncbi:MAG: pirin family protein [Deltaproteobacteria bacterium]
MSVTQHHEPACDPCSDSHVVALKIAARERDIGAFTVARILPSARRRLVGPFIFFDHVGPAELPPGVGMNVRPHPHIGLATVTYLFEGEIHHRDSLGFSQPIRPGAINWMTAGRGIVHSERSSPEVTAAARVHGIQLWVALPKEHEEAEPAFVHHPADTIPAVQLDGVKLRVLIGSAYGVASPVQTLAPMVYAELILEPGASLALPDVEERAAYVVTGALQAGDETGAAREMLVFEPGAVTLRAGEEGAHVMLIGGPPIDGERHIFWNFVSSSKARIERAKAEWREEKFPVVPGDEAERIPLPE